MISKLLYRNINATLLDQHFSVNASDLELQVFKQSLIEYVKIENCVAVLSDFKANVSYIYGGAFTKFFGIDDNEGMIDSAFEDFIFDKVHPSDLYQRHQLELKYIEMQLKTPMEDRVHFNTQCRIRVRNNEGKYIYITHQMRYPKSLADGSIWLALCIYAPSTDQSLSGGIDAAIYNSITGDVINFSDQTMTENSELSDREIQILTLISEGLSSKNIASHLEIALNTVNRHRQNIIRKMKVSNLTEAVTKARLLGTFKN